MWSHRKTLLIKRHPLCPDSFTGASIEVGRYDVLSLMAITKLGCSTEWNHFYLLGWNWFTPTIALRMCLLHETRFVLTSTDFLHRIISPSLTLPINSSTPIWWWKVSKSLSCFNQGQQACLPLLPVRSCCLPCFDWYLCGNLPIESVLENIFPFQQCILSPTILCHKILQVFFRDAACKLLFSCPGHGKGIGVTNISYWCFYCKAGGGEVQGF